MCRGPQPDPAIPDPTLLSTASDLRFDDRNVSALFPRLGFFADPPRAKNASSFAAATLDLQL
jgi:hypothetical protein